MLDRLDSSFDPSAARYVTDERLINLEFVKPIAGYQVVQRDTQPGRATCAESRASRRWRTDSVIPVQAGRRKF